MRTLLPFAHAARSTLSTLSRGLVPAAVVALFTAGCNPTYAPPIRAVQYGAPGRVRQGDVELGGTVAGVIYPTAGSFHVAVGVRDWISLEGGGTFVVAPAGPAPIAASITAWAGPRFTLPRRRYGASLLLDAELGVGAGVGGELCNMTNSSGGGVCDLDGKGWQNRAAAGGYQGLGLGFGVAWFSLYGRARLEESVATGIPVTYWPSAMLGFGFELSNRVSLDLGGGYLGYANAADRIDGWFYQFGVSGRIGPAR